MFRRKQESSQTRLYRATLGHRLLGEGSQSFQALLRWCVEDVEGPPNDVEIYWKTSLEGHEFVLELSYETGGHRLLLTILPLRAGRLLFHARQYKMGELEYEDSGTVFSVGQARGYFLWLRGFSSLVPEGLTQVDELDRQTFEQETLEGPFTSPYPQGLVLISYVPSLVDFAGVGEEEPEPGQEHLYLRGELIAISRGEDKDSIKALHKIIEDNRKFCNLLSISRYGAHVLDICRGEVKPPRTIKEALRLYKDKGRRQ